MWICILFWRQSRTRYPLTERRALSPKRMTNVLQVGVAYISSSTRMKALLLRTAIFCFTVSVLWALLPLFCRSIYHLTSTQYGIALTAFGIGTLLGAVFIPRVRQVLSMDAIAASGTAMFIGTIFTIALNSRYTICFASLLSGGIGWIFVISAYNSGVLLTCPHWVRARAVAIYLLVFQGSFALGTLFWGLVANSLGMKSALLLGGSLSSIALLISCWLQSTVSGSKIESEQLNEQAFSVDSLEKML